jgi:hypothetical protein
MMEVILAKTRRQQQQRRLCGHEAHVNATELALHDYVYHVDVERLLQHDSLKPGQNVTREASHARSLAVLNASKKVELRTFDDACGHRPYRQYTECGTGYTVWKHSVSQMHVEIRTTRQ